MKRELAANEVRVSKDSTPPKLASYIAHTLKSYDTVDVFAIGQEATYHAIMAIIRTIGLAKQNRLDLKIEPYLKDTVDDHGNETTAVAFALEVV